MVPSWLTVVSWVSIILALLCAAFILYDIFGRGYRQQMGIMEAVWPVTALYFGPLLWTVGDLDVLSVGPPEEREVAGGG